MVRSASVTREGPKLAPARTAEDVDADLIELWKFRQLAKTRGEVRSAENFNRLLDERLEVTR